MIPIGIMYGGRVRCLDATLRSLSASTLDHDQPLIVFDDSPQPEGGDAPQYLVCNSADRPVYPPEMPWHPTLNKAGLQHIMQSSQRQMRCVGDRVQKYPINSGGKRQAGVVRGSHDALITLFRLFPEAEAVILLQDDIAFVQDWFDRLWDIAHVAANKLPRTSQVGLLSGLRVNQALPEGGRKLEGHIKGNTALELQSSTTATCLYLTRKCFEAIQPWLAAPTDRTTQFDDYLAREVRRAGFGTWLVVPYVCQHFGVSSVVRPELRFTDRGPQGRIGFHCDPKLPFVLADEVRKFAGPPA